MSTAELKRTSDGEIYQRMCEIEKLPPTPAGYVAFLEARLRDANHNYQVLLNKVIEAANSAGTSDYSPVQP